MSRSECSTPVAHLSHGLGRDSKNRGHSRQLSDSAMVNRQLSDSFSSDEDELRIKRPEPSKCTRSRFMGLFYKLTSPTTIEPQLFRRRTVLSILSIIILLERIAFYHVCEVLTVELGQAKRWDDAAETLETEALLFTGVCYFLPIFGGLITCGFTGRYLSIVIGSLVYLLGAVFLAIDCPPIPRTNITIINETVTSPVCQWSLSFLYFPLTLIAIGTALLKTALYPFFVQQATLTLVDLKRQTIEQTFAWIYTLMAAGEVISVVIAFFMIDPTRPFMPPIVAIICLTLIIILFSAATTLYTRQETKRRVLKDIILLLKKRLRTFFGKYHINRNRPSSSIRTPLIGKVRRQIGVQYAGKESVFAVKQLGRVLPVFAALLLYYCLFPQVTAIISRDLRNVSFLPNKDEEPDLLKSSHFIIRGQATIQFFEVFIVPLVFVVVLPLCRRFKKEPQFYPKIGIGNIILIVSLVLSVVVEFIRHYGTGISAGDKLAYVLALSILVSLSDTTMTVTAFTFTYIEAPEGLEDLFFGLFLCMCGIGFLIGAGMISISKASFLPRDMVRHQEVYMMVLIVFLVLNILLVFYLSNKHRLSSRYRETCHQVTQQSSSQSEASDQSTSDLSLRRNENLQSTSERKQYLSVVTW